MTASQPGQSRRVVARDILGRERPRGRFVGTRHTGAKQWTRQRGRGTDQHALQEITALNGPILAQLAVYGLPLAIVRHVLSGKPPPPNRKANVFSAAIQSLDRCSCSRVGDCGFCSERPRNSESSAGQIGYGIKGIRPYRKGYPPACYDSVGPIRREGPADLH
jgi:hypothetical protein